MGLNFDIYYSNFISSFFRYVELFSATNIPHPIKTVTFRAVSGVPARLTAAPRPLYSSFAEGEFHLFAENGCENFVLGSNQELFSEFYLYLSIHFMAAFKIVFF